MKPSASFKKVESAFFRGDLAKFIDLDHGDKTSGQLAHLVISAHFALGQLEKGQWLFESFSRKKLTRFQMSQSLFFYIVALVRRSQYEAARRQLITLCKLRHHSPLCLFFSYQALGFLRYFEGNFTKSGALAKEAVRLAAKNRFVYGELLALDLLGHSLTLSGAIRRGQSTLEQALKLSKKLQNRNLEGAIQISLTINKSRYGLVWNGDEIIFENLKKISPQDSYSRSLLFIELANQYILRGKTDEAFAVLQEASASIYANQNRRQIAAFNIKLSHIMFLRGRQQEALLLLKTARTQLHPSVDRQLASQMHGLELKIIGQPATVPRPTANDLDMRISHRDLGRRCPHAIGEDPMGDLYDGISRKDKKSLKFAIQKGLYYFLHRFFDINVESQALYFDLLPNALIVIDQGNSFVLEKGVSRNARSLIMQISSAHQTKAELIEKTWGYSYDPSRHDSLVYNAISKLRKDLGPAGKWIEADEKGYKLKSGVKVISRIDELEAEKTTAPQLLPQYIRPGLNIRQSRIMIDFERHNIDAINVEKWMTKFTVSRATATRDLADLVKMSYLVPVGRARATYYTRNFKGEEK